MVEDKKQIEQHGRMNSNILFRLLQDSDHNKLQEFCNRCDSLGYYNNSSFKAINLEKMKMPHGQFFVGYDVDKDIIFNLCGVHSMKELNTNAYRVFYRGATLPGYTTGQHSFRASYQLMEVLNMQIDFIININPAAEFYFTTNIEKSSTNGKSQRMNENMVPRVARTGIFTLVDDNFEYMYTKQKLWRVNVPEYKAWRLD